MPKYTLTVNIEERGTMHTDRDKNTTNPSMAGHMWLGASDGVDKLLEFGFASESGMPFDMGVLKDDDNSSYAGEPRYSRTTEITKEQFDRFRDIHENRALSNFDFNNYNAITNNCVAHTWSVLNEIGIETGGFLGELMPISNAKYIDELFENHKGFLDNVGSYKDSAKSINHWRDYWDSRKLEYPYPDDLNDPFNFDSCKKGYFEINLDRFRVIDMSGINKDDFIGWNGPTIKDSLEDLLGDTIWRVEGDEDSVSEIVSDDTPSIKDLKQLKEKFQMDPCDIYYKIIKDIDLAISSSKVCDVFNSRFGYTDLDIANDLSDFRTRILIVKN